MWVFLRICITKDFTRSHVWNNLCLVQHRQSDRGSQFGTDHMQTALPTEHRHVTHLFVLQFDTSILFALVLQWGVSQSDSSGWCPEGPRGRKISLGRSSHLTSFILCYVLFLFPMLLYFNDSPLLTLKCLIIWKNMK